MAKCVIDSAFSFYPIFGKLAGKQNMRQSFLPFLRQLKHRWAIAAPLGSELIHTKYLKICLLLIYYLGVGGGERGGSVVECRTPEREVPGSRPTAAVWCPWARHFTPRKYWLITQEAMAPSRYDWKIVDWDVKPQHNQPTNGCRGVLIKWYTFLKFWMKTEQVFWIYTE